jgi:hypothetical protein
MRHRIQAILGLSVALAMAFGVTARVQAGDAPDDGSADDPISVQAPAFSVQGPPTGLAVSPPTPQQALPTPPPPPQQQPQLVDLTAVRTPSTSIAPFATAQCRDGWFSYSQTREVTCAGHQGVLIWVTLPGTASAVLWERQLQAAGMLGNGSVCVNVNGVCR